MCAYNESFKMKVILFGIVFNILVICNLNEACITQNPTYRFSGSDIVIKLQKICSGAQQYSIVRYGNILQTVTLDDAFAETTTIKSTPKILTLIGKNQTTEFELITNQSGLSMIQVRRNLRMGQTSQDCFDLNIGKVNWYGGPENRHQYWPVEKATFTNYSYITKEEDNCAITERYWLNSNGIFIYIDENVPLFINQNAKGHENQLCFHSSKILPYNIDDESDFTLNYKIGIAADARQAHLHAANNIVFKKPIHVPDELMVRHPIWSTWALYKTEINETIVRDFAEQILENNFNNSQLEIDDDWEECYGALTFNRNKFPDIKNLTDDLKSQGFRVTLWIHPFINKNCVHWYNEAKQKGYLVVDHNGNSDTQWWDSGHGEAAYIDFTNKDAADWYVNRLKKLQQEAGIDSFKFDAGESSWSPPNPVQNGAKSLQPSLITSAYVQTVAKFGPIVEVRSGQGTQDLPIFVRMIDKDSEWNWNNGLTTLLTTLFQLNFAGYNFVLPDMIGGNGYNNHPPNSNMFIRWVQANVFMPSLQFSYVPWMFDDNETIAICHTYTKLHDNITDYIMERFELVTTTGEPVNPPIWWIDPSDVVARQIYDEFLLGDKYLSAPVIQENQNERDIYLPSGLWRDGNTQELHVGPKWLMSYNAPIHILPYFIRENSNSNSNVCLV